MRIARRKHAAYGGAEEEKATGVTVQLARAVCLTGDSRPAKQMNKKQKLSR
jgi:hypothetical protein